MDKGWWACAIRWRHQRRGFMERKFTLKNWWLKHCQLLKYWEILPTCTMTIVTSSVPCHHLSGGSFSWTLQSPGRRQNWGSPCWQCFEKLLLFINVIFFLVHFSFSCFFFLLLLFLFFFFFFFLHTVINQHINVLVYLHLECWKTNSTKDQFGHLPYWFSMVILLGFFHFSFQDCKQMLQEQIKYSLPKTVPCAMKTSNLVSEGQTAPPLLFHRENAELWISLKFETTFLPSSKSRCTLSHAKSQTYTHGDEENAH